MNCTIRNTIALGTFVLFGAVNAANAQTTTYADGANHVINTDLGGQFLVLSHGNPARATPTSITVNLGAVIGNPNQSSYGVFLMDDSIATFNGGNVSIVGTGGATLYLTGSSNTTIYGGSFSNGIASNIIYGQSSGSLDIYGGTFSAGAKSNALFASRMGSVSIYGGTFTTGDLGADIDSGRSNRVDIYGGLFSVGADGLGFVASNQDINFYGQNLKFTPTGIDSFGHTDGILTGTLQGGSSLNIAAQTFPGFKFNFISATVVPEPGNIALPFGMITIGAARKRRSLKGNLQK